MYSVIRKVHLWLAVPFGVLIFVICLTGLILLFEPAHAQGSQRPEFFLDVMRLHRWLMDAPAQKGMMTTGKMIVGISVIAFVLILISGIVLWWQRARHGIRKNLRIVTSKGWFPMIDTLHVAGGIYTVAFLLVMALTGLTWSFGWYRTWFNAIFGIEKGSHVVYAIHTGAFGGLATQIIWGLSALMGIALVITGYCIWIRRLRLPKANSLRK